MKLLKIIVTIVLVFVGLLNSNSQLYVSNNGKKEITTVYYFHKTRRCPTCMAIEKQIRKVLKEEPFATAKKDNVIVFKFLSSDNSVNNKLVKEFGVNGSALIVVKGDEKTDLTNQAFLYARTQPEKFKQILRETLG